MTDAENTARTTPEPDAAAPARRWKLATGLAVAIAVLAVGVAAFAITRDDDQQRTATQQVAAARQACQQWLDSGNGPSGNGPGRAWCDDMAGWMTDNMPSGQTMMGPMMWASPEAMRDVCVQATGSGGTGIDDPTRWCDQMVGWWSDRMGDWDHWDDYWGD